MIFLTAVVVSLPPTNAFFSGTRRTRVDRDRAHPNVCLEGGRGSGVQGHVGMGISENEGRVLQLSKTQLTSIICFKRRHGSCDCNEVRSPFTGRIGLQLAPCWSPTTWYDCVLRPADGTRVIGTVPLDTSSSQCFQYLREVPDATRVK